MLRSVARLATVVCLFRCSNIGTCTTGRLPVDRYIISPLTMLHMHRVSRSRLHVRAVFDLYLLTEDLEGEMGFCTGEAYPSSNVALL